MQGGLSFLNPAELQCLLGYVITKHGSALGPASGAAGAPTAADGIVHG
jgi:hypothetical protein